MDDKEGSSFVLIVSGLQPVLLKPYMILARSSPSDLDAMAMITLYLAKIYTANKPILAFC